MEEFDKARNDFIPMIEIPQERYDALVREEVTVNTIISALRQFGTSDYRTDAVLKTLFPAEVKEDGDAE